MGGTGSWIAQKYQGKGYGTEARRAIVHFGFLGLGLDAINSAAFPGNSASIAISRKLGYQRNGVRRIQRGDSYADALSFQIRREDWVQHPAYQENDIEIDGLDVCRAHLNLD